MKKTVQLSYQIAKLVEPKVLDSLLAYYMQGRYPSGTQVKFVQVGSPSKHSKVEILDLSQLSNCSYLQLNYLGTRRVANFLL